MTRLCSRAIASLVLVSALRLAAEAAAAESGPDPKLSAAVLAANAEWAAAMKTGDAAKIAAPYADEAVFIGLDGSCVKGRPAIEAMYRDRFVRQGFAAATRIESKRLIVDGGLAYESGYGEMTMTKDGKPVKSGGPYLTVWQRQRDGAWKILRNIVLP